MAIIRRLNVISQQRVDGPDLRSLESAMSNDFDALMQSFVTGTAQGYVIRGFQIAMAGAIGGAASGLQMIVDPGAVLHTKSNVSGTVYLVPTGTPAQPLNSATNTIVDGAFAPSAINYVGLEYERFVDPTTSAQVYVWNPTTKNETTKNAPRAQILRYRFKITTSSFAPNVLPIATVTTDSGNNVVSITDTRYMLFRLGTGGASPNPFYVYPWTAQPEGRTESPSTSSSPSVNPFSGGDKMLSSLKDWMNAIMTAIQEIKGTVYWYSPGSAGSIDSIRTDLGNTLTTGRGVITHDPDTAGQIVWDEDIFLKIIGSRLSYRFVANPSSTDIVLSDNQVAYVSLVRDVEISPNLVFTSSSAVVTSVGSVAWTSALQSGDWVKLGETTVAGYYQIQSVDSLSQVTLTTPFMESSTGAGGAKAKYAFGSYSTSPAPSSNRHIQVADRASVPQGQNIFWFLLRADNGGIVPRVYVRFIGSELEMGESEEIDDGVSRNLLEYIGSPSESARYPQYSSAINPGALPEITDLEFGPASSLSSNEYFYINSSANARRYYMWVNLDGAGVDPIPAANMVGIELAISTGDTDLQVASAAALALSNTAFPDFNAVVRQAPNDTIVRVTNRSAGATDDATNSGSMGAPFAINIIQQGVGDGNYVVNDGDSLTKAIKKLDDVYGALLASLNAPSYDEPVDIVASGETPPSSLNGPLPSGTIIDLPLNSRAGGASQYYTVGSGSLQVFLNGQFLRLGSDWDEVGTIHHISNQIEILQELEVGDSLEFRLSAGGGGGGGSNVPGPQGPAGPPGASGADAVGGPVAISVKTGDYTVLTSDNVLLGDATSNAIIFTLPPAATAAGQVFFFKKIDSSPNTVTIKGNLTETIDGSNTFVLGTINLATTVICDGSQYWLF